MQNYGGYRMQGVPVPLKIVKVWFCRNTGPRPGTELGKKGREKLGRTSNVPGRRKTPTRLPWFHHLGEKSENMSR